MPTVGEEKTRNFVNSFKQRYGIEPDAWAALTYDALGIVAEAIEKAGPDRKAIRDYVAAMDSPEKGYDGVAGLTYFNEDGDCLKPLIVAVVKDGEFVPFEKQAEDLERAKEALKASAPAEPTPTEGS